MDKEVISETAVLPTDLNEGASVPPDLSVSKDIPTSPDSEVKASNDSISEVATCKLPLKKQLSRQFGEYSAGGSQHHGTSCSSDETAETSNVRRVRKRLSSSQCNPTLDDIDIDTKKMRGDAIGSTLYSERWVIKLLMKLSKWNEVTWSKEIEEELCCLWDMTLEADVTAFLMQNNILDILFVILQHQQEFRAMEIFLGIVGNLCFSIEARHKIIMNTDFLRLLLKLLELPDTLALIQLMRPLKACLIEFRYFFENRCLPNRSLPSASKSEEASGKSSEPTQKAGNTVAERTNMLENSVLPVMRVLVSTTLWHPHIVFILNSSRSKQLLKDTLELLDNLLGILLNPDSMSPQLCTPQMVGALIETLNELQKSIDKEANEHKSKPHDIITRWVSIVAYFSGSIEGSSVLAERDHDITRALCRHISPDLLVDNIHPDSITLIKNATEIIVHIIPEWHFSVDIFSLFVSILTVLKERETQRIEALAENNQQQPNTEKDEIQSLLDDLMWPVEYVCMTMVDDTMNDDKEDNKSLLISAINRLPPVEIIILSDVLHKHSIEMPGPKHETENDG